MSDDPNDRSERRRKISVSDAEDLLGDISAAQMKGDFRKMERRLAEVFGADWDGGDFASMQRTQARHEERMGRMETTQAEQALFHSNLKVSIRWTVALASLAATIIGALALVGVEHFLK